MRFYRYFHVLMFLEFSYSGEAVILQSGSLYVSATFSGHHLNRHTDLTFSFTDWLKVMILDAR